MDRRAAHRACSWSSSRRSCSDDHCGGAAAFHFGSGVTVATAGASENTTGRATCAPPGASRGCRPARGAIGISNSSARTPIDQTSRHVVRDTISRLSRYATNSSNNAEPASRQFGEGRRVVPAGRPSGPRHPRQERAALELDRRGAATTIDAGASLIATRMLNAQRRRTPRSSGRRRSQLRVATFSAALHTRHRRRGAASHAAGRIRCDRGTPLRVGSDHRLMEAE